MGCEVPMLRSCCCGCTLRTGSKLIGWLYLICGILFSAAYMGFVFIEEAATSPAVSLSLLIAETTTCIIQTVSSFLLLIGAYGGRRCPVFSWVVANTLVVIINIFVLTAYLFLNNVAFSVFNIICMLIQLYFVVVVYSYYRDMTDSSTFSV